MNSKRYERALRKATKQGSPTKAVYELLSSSDKEGDPRATYALATWYLLGTKFTRKNVTRAAKMLRQAALRGVPEAAFDFAVSLEKGTGVRKSEKEALRFYTMAALLGHKKSYFEVGRMHYHGLGTNKDRKLAHIWLDRAASFGIST